MEKYYEYLKDIVGEVRDSWIHYAIASHLRNKFKELGRSESILIVKKFIAEGEQNELEKNSPV